MVETVDSDRWASSEKRRERRRALIDVAAGEELRESGIVGTTTSDEVVDARLDQLLHGRSGT